MMIQRRRRVHALLLLAGDLVATIGAFVLAYWLRFGLEVVPVTKGEPGIERYLELVPFVAVLWPVVFYFQGLYQREHARLRIDEVLRLAVAVGFAALVLAAALTFYRPVGADGSQPFTYSRAFLVVFAVTDLVMVVTVRWLVSTVLARLRRRRGMQQRVLVVGAGELGREVVGRLHQQVDWGIRVVGFLDDDPGRRNGAFVDVPVVGTTADLEEVVASMDIDQVVLALPLSSHNRTAQLIQRAGQLLVEIKVVPDLLQYYVLRAGTEELDGLPVISLAQVPLQGFNAFVKRVADVLGAVTGLILTAPVLAVAAAFIRREDGGPVLYTQVRTGLDGRSFHLYKLRTMTVDAEPDGQPRWTRSNDDRVTRIGRFLRAAHLDELPQLVNVLRGDMSLVGPRPERPEFVDKFRDQIPDYMARHRVRAGMTGLAQVEGLKGDTSIRRRVARDLYYIENWSLALDLKILWKTARLVMRGFRR